MTSLAQLRSSNTQRQAAWPGGEHIDASFRAIELGGEVGELLNELKKYIRNQKGIKGKATDDTEDAQRERLDKIAEELADVVICADLVAMELNIDLSVAVPYKFNKTSEKVGIDVLFDTSPTATDVFGIWAEWDIGQEGLVYTTYEAAKDGARELYELQFVDEGDETFEEAWDAGLIGVEEYVLEA